MKLKTVSIFGFLLMAGGIVGLIVTRTIVSKFVPAIVAQVAAFALMLWGRRTFGRRSFHLGADPTEGGLITTGPYRFIRHPIYSAVCLFVWAAVFGSPSISTASLAVVVTVGTLMRVFAEERLLLQRFPEYEEYSRRTKRLIPFLF